MFFPFIVPNFGGIKLGQWLVVSGQWSVGFTFYLLPLPS